MFLYFSRKQSVPSNLYIFEVDKKFSQIFSIVLKDLVCLVRKVKEYPETVMKATAFLWKP